MPRSILPLALIVSVLAGAASAPAIAGGADAGAPDKCAQLMVEQTHYKERGVVDDMNKGADWGKANLSPERLREIRDYLALEEELKFGCREATLLIDPKSLVDPAARAAAPAGAAGAATGVGDPAAKPKKKRKRPTPANEGGSGENQNAQPAGQEQKLILPGANP